jgi:hypothetical protein
LALLVLLQQGKIKPEVLAALQVSTLLLLLPTVALVAARDTLAQGQVAVVQDVVRLDTPEVLVEIQAVQQQPLVAVVRLVTLGLAVAVNVDLGVVVLAVQVVAHRAALGALMQKIKKAVAALVFMGRELVALPTGLVVQVELLELLP